ncbi:MAG: alpha-amylase family glycosyl hydrolase [Thermoanaerobaculia bacterium]
MKQSIAGLAAVLLLASACKTSSYSPAPQPAAPAAAVKTTTPPPKTDWRDSVLYFVILDRFADGDPANNINVDVEAKGAFHGGDLAGLRAQLDDIASLGVTALWITPAVKNIDGFVTGAGFPDWAYHGYWADDFDRLDPRFGTERQLKDLVDAAHARGIKVLLDVVYNHAGYNTHYLTDPKTKNWLRSNETGTCGNDDLTSCLSGLPDWKTELPEVRDFLMNAQLGWAKRVGLDGFRLDTVKHVEHDFWQQHRKRSRAEVGPDFFLLGEVWGGDAQSLDPWFAGDEMDAGFDFGFQGSVLGWLQGRGRTIAFDRYLKSREKVRTGYLLSQFLSSHDVKGALAQLDGNKDLFRLAAIVELTTVGIPMIDYGEEVARPGGDWPENRSDMPWGDRPIRPGAGKPRDELLRADYKKLIAIRKAHPALSRGVHNAVSTDGDVLVFSRKDEASHDEVIVAVNRGDAPAGVTIPWRGATANDVWNNEPLPVDAGMIKTAVAPKRARIVAER